MPVTIREQPHPLDFAGNRTRFLLRGNPVVTIGSRNRSVWRINALPSSVLTVTCGDTVYDFAITTPYQALDNAGRIAAYTNATQLQNELVKKVAENYAISRLYDVTVANDLTITFLSKDYGGEAVTLDGNGSGDIELLEQTDGVARTERPNYGIFARFEVTRYYGGAVQTLDTPEMLLHLNADYLAELPLEILRQYFPAADVPFPTETFAAYPLRYATLKFRLTFSDMFGEIPQVGVLKHSQEFLLSCGKLEEENRSLNLADWKTVMGTNVQLSYYDDIRDFGSPTGLTIRSYARFPQYAYFMLFNEYRDNAYTRILKVALSVMTRDGHTFPIEMGTVSVTNRNIVRIPLSVTALGIPSADDVLSYTVKAVNESGSAWTRTFVIERRPHGSQEFLLQNRLGLLESLFTDTSASEEQTEGSDTMKNGEVGVDITDTATIYTARTGYRTARELQLVADATRSRFNHRIINGKAVPIAILPDTLTVTDTAEDLMEAEFQYRFNSPASTGKPGNLPDNPGTAEKWEDSFIWSDSFHSELPQSNTIATQYNKVK
ncbi:MAG: hypothetical protein K6F40_03110 [Bacteroidales bacterium]|nr:hypothetical protein [Bacteroidales bacterium]